MRAALRERRASEGDEEEEEGGDEEDEGEEEGEGEVVGFFLVVDGESARMGGVRESAMRTRRIRERTNTRRKGFNIVVRVGWRGDRRGE